MNNSQKIFESIFILSLICIPLFIISLFLDNPTLVGIIVISFFVLMSIGVRAYPQTKGFSFTVSVFAAVSLAMFFPWTLTNIGDYKTTGLIVPLIQVIMFGMGTAMSLKDFAGVIKMPKGVMVGVLCQFTIMPIIGVTIALTFGFAPEVAAGIVLIGSSPSGVASNVMAFLAKGNLALSVTLTAVATLVAPVMTPFLMQTFAGQFVPIEFIAMMKSIINMIIIPIAAGLLFNYIFRGKANWLHKIMPIISMAGIVIIIAVITAAGRDNLLVIGVLLFVAGIIHNGAGYLFGYWFCRLLKMDERDCRTIALEVGMQNAGMASGIAVEMGRAATMGLAPAIFGPWMNISGSFLANWWRGKPIEGVTDSEFKEQQA
jgi:BASS family bile acid:Na+ symporter